MEHITTKQSNEALAYSEWQRYIRREIYSTFYKNITLREQHTSKEQINKLTNKSNDNDKRTK